MDRVNKLDHLGGGQLTYIQGFVFQLTKKKEINANPNITEKMAKII